jgi:hypothetical protein
MLQSKFSYSAIIPFVISLLLFVFLIAVVIVFQENLTSKSSIPMFLIGFLFIFFLLWLVWGELRTKAIKVWIETDSIIAINFLGLGTSKTFRFSEIDGYKITMLPAEYRDYEYLYLIINQQKVIKLSEFYHENYFELKKVITKKCKHLGTEKFNLMKEIRGIFR